MTPSAPEWITSDLFESHLQNYYKNSDIRVVSIDVSPGVGKSENFNSLIYRVRVEFMVSNGIRGNENFLFNENLRNSLFHKIDSRQFQDVELKEVSILIKIQLPDLTASLSHAIIFDKEGEVYSRFLPKIKVLLHQLNEPMNLLPELIGVCANKAILMEDLSVKGYKVAPKLVGLSLADTRVVLRKAALFHATCAVLQEKEPNIFNNFKHGIQ